jgi:uncharacterized protein YlzI (FlbEa/FlbD family)
MIWVTDANTGQKVAINPDYVIAVFVAPDGDLKGKTAINLINGQLIVEESDFDVVASIKND